MSLVHDIVKLEKDLREASAERDRLKHDLERLRFLVHPTVFLAFPVAVKVQYIVDLGKTWRKTRNVGQAVTGLQLGDVPVQENGQTWVFVDVIGDLKRRSCSCQFKILESDERLWALEYCEEYEADDLHPWRETAMQITLDASFTSDWIAEKSASELEAGRKGARAKAEAENQGLRTRIEGLEADKALVKAAWATLQKTLGEKS